MTGRNGFAFVALLTALILGLTALLVWPFAESIAAAVLLGVAFYPVHERIKRHVEGENRPAVLSSALVALCVLVPVTLLILTAVSQAAPAFASVRGFIMQDGLSRLAGAADPVLMRLGLPAASAEQTQAWLRDHIEAIGTWGLNAAGRLLGRVGNIVGTSLMSVFFLFFVFRDGAQTWRNLTSFTPLSPQQLARLASAVKDTMAANVNGVLAVGVAQGAATGILLWAVGLPSPILWGCVAGIASIVPPFGASMVWFPAAVALVVMGSLTKGLIVLVVGAAVVASLDNIIRPLVLQGRVQMGTLAVLVSLLGGLQAFGLLGLFAGPVIFALAAELARMLWEEYASRNNETSLDKG